VENSHPGLLADIAQQKSLTDEIKTGLKQVLEDFKHNWGKETLPTDFAAAPARPATTGCCSAGSRRAASGLTT
jgi:hypothetical protein